MTATALILTSLVFSLVGALDSKLSYKPIHYQGNASFNSRGIKCKAFYNFEWTKMSKTTATSFGSGLVQCNDAKAHKFNFTENTSGLLEINVPGFANCVGALGKIRNNIGKGKLDCDNGASGEFIFQLRRI